MALNITMQGVVFQGHAFEMVVASNLSVPTIINQTDAVIRVSTAAICGSDLHIYRGTQAFANPPWTMGHEAVGYVESIGTGVSSLAPGDMVIVPFTASAGHLTNHLLPEAGENFGIGTGLEGTQSEYLRVPFADDTLITVPTANSSLELDYLMVSDIFATGWIGLDYAGFEPGDTVTVFGAGPVGLLCAYSAILRGASRVYVVDHWADRLRLAQSIGAIPIDFTASDPVAQIMAREPQGVTRSVDCVGFEAVNRNFTRQSNIIFDNMLAVTSTGGGMSSVGVYSEQNMSTAGAPNADGVMTQIPFAIGEFFTKGLSYRSGATDPKTISAQLVELIASGRAKPGFVVSAVVGIEEAPAAYRRFERHEEVKVVIRF